MMKHVLITILLGMSFTISVAAATLPDYYPDGFKAWGTIDRVNANEGIIVIDDELLKLTSGLRVYTTSTKFGSGNLLRAGMRVGFHRNRDKTIRELWVLPKDYNPRDK